MKKLIILISLVVAATNVYSQPLVYFDFISHDEDTGPWSNTTYYTADRTKLINLATYFQSKGITFNLQSDWLYLTNVISKETPALMATTNNKNILRWMIEDKGVEMDPHSHEKQYIYPDIVKLMDSLGLPESKLIGGSLYGEKNGKNVWTNLINGQYGLIFPNKFWQPDYLMGGGSKNHVADLNYYGFWNPKDTSNYLTHYPTNHLRHIGTGCEIKLHDTSTVEEVVAELKDVMQKVQSGNYPSNGFYVQTIFFGHGDLNNVGFYDKLIAVADSANVIVASGKAQWKTLKQAYTKWETDYNAQVFQWECGQISNGLYEFDKESTTSIYPNPFSTQTTLHTDVILKSATLIVYNSIGQPVKQIDNISGQTILLSRDVLANGLYFICLTEGDKLIAMDKVVISD